MRLLGYNISVTFPDYPPMRQIIVNTINPHSFCVAEKDKDFQLSLQDSDILLPDGIGIVYAARILKGKNIPRLAGYDIFLHIMKELNRTSGSCFFLGSSENTLNLIKKKAAREYPDVKVSIFSPPFRSVFSATDNILMCETVNREKPDVLFVGMTAPKQEKWVHQNKGRLNTQLICSIGAVFDFYSGVIKRPSKFWINSGLEWLPRFLKEPRRLANRNIVSTPMFCWIVIMNLLKRDRKF